MKTERDRDSPAQYDNVVSWRIDLDIDVDHDLPRQEFDMKVKGKKDSSDVTVAENNDHNEPKNENASSKL